MQVVDASGEYVGKVTDLWPDDGGGEPELALVAVGRRFARRRYVPLGPARVVGGMMILPWSRMEIDEAPSAEDRRWGDPAHVALAHWRAVDD